MDEVFYQEIVKAATHDIFRVVSESVRLLPDGKDFRGTCTFCGEEGFAIASRTGIFECMCCWRSGNALDFLSMIRGVPLDAIAVELAERYGLREEN